MTKTKTDQILREAPYNAVPYPLIPEHDIVELGERVARTLLNENSCADWMRLSFMHGRCFEAGRRAGGYVR